MKMCSWAVLWARVDDKDYCIVKVCSMAVMPYSVNGESVIESRQARGCRRAAWSCSDARLHCGRFSQVAAAAAMVLVMMAMEKG